MPLINANIVPNAVTVGFQLALAQGKKWNHADVQAAKNVLVACLIVAQGSRCAYCQRLIKDEIGHRELDHILPKGATGKAARWVSNLAVHRRSTAGYPQYRFEPKNLILTCKRCNHRKGNYDCRANRLLAAGLAYPAAAADFQWIHPFHHDYDGHITLLKDFVYQAIPGSNGLAVIEACKLQGIQALEARARELHRQQLKDANKLTLQMLIDDSADNDIVDAVAHQFPLVAKGEVRRLLRGYHKNKIA